jgi:hypothetical protein
MPINRATQLASARSSEDGPAEIGPNEGTSGKKDLGPSTVTLSGLLNAIDGVSSQVSDFTIVYELSDSRIGRFGPLRLDELPG